MMDKNGRRLCILVVLILIVNSVYAVCLEEQEPWKYRRLFDAVCAGKTDVVGEALAAGLDPNLSVPQQDSMLIQATQFGHLDIIKMLLKCGADPKVKGNERLLNVAIETGRMDILKCLVEAGASVSGPNGSCPYDHYDPCLGTAIYGVRPQMVEYLLKNGADPNDSEQPGDTSVLQMAAIQGDVDIMKMLVAVGAEINHRDCQGWSAMMYACSKGHVPAVEFLLNKGADPTYKDAYGRSAATLPNERGGEDSKKIGQLLLSSIPPNASESSEAGGPWITALLFGAVRADRRDLVEKNLAGGADPNMKDPCRGYSLLAAATISGHLDIIKMLLNHGADPKAEGNEKLVTYAIITGSMDILKCISEAGALITPPQSSCFEGDFLSFAVSMKRPKIVEYLLQHGVSPKDGSSNCRTTALMAASWLGDTRTIELLIAAGANINHRDCNGWSALMHACNNGDIAAVKLLLANGADPSFRDGYDKTAAELAGGKTGKNAQEIRRLFLEKEEH